MLRRISNYLSSAFSLVEYAREHMRENYQETKTMEISLANNIIINGDAI